MLKVAHLAGMTEIATGVLHNVGNVLNNVNISTTVINDRLRRLRVDGLAKLAETLGADGDDLAAFLAKDGNARRIKQYLSGLNAELAGEQQALLAEVGLLVDKVGHIRNIIAAEQRYARRMSFREQCDVERLVEDVLLMHGYTLNQRAIEVRRDFEELPVGMLERSKLLQVLDNLIKNAIESMSTHDGPRKELSVTVRQSSADRARIEVGDTGKGIAPADAERIFNFGFTTKDSGNGFGLHSAANALTEMGGSIAARSDGPGLGATFAIEFPLVQEPAAPAGGDAPQRADALLLGATLAVPRAAALSAV
ncbi:MAG TPA: HAMP domain-containing sensor histidine kinase [Pirellulales bacterium]|nr:HAMP domain-containing sensor histidine kinase [Pirellulales bacterium]